MNVIMQYCLITVSIQLSQIGRHSLSKLRSNFALDLVITCIIFFDPAGANV